MIPKVQSQDKVVGIATLSNLDIFSPYIKLKTLITFAILCVLSLFSKSFAITLLGTRRRTRKSKAPAEMELSVVQWEV